MTVFSKQFLGMAKRRDTAELNLRSTKGTNSSSCHVFQNKLPWLISFSLDHLSQVTADRDAANLRVAQLEERLAVLEREKAAAKDEAVTATRRAERAEEKERAAAQQEEELIPRVTAIVNSMNGNFFSLCCDHWLLHLFTDYRLLQ